MPLSSFIFGFKSPEELLLHHAQKYQKKEAIVAFDPDTGEIQKISYRDFYELVHDTACFLTSNGINQGDSFAILMHNSPEILIFELAGALVGAATVPLDYKRDTPDRKIYKLQETKAKALFVKLESNESKKELGTLQKELPEMQIFSWKSFEEYVGIINKTNKTNKIHIVNDFKSTYIILYTSGTTAHPKGAILTTRACLLNADGIAKWQKFTAYDRFGVVLPLHHINSTIFCLSMILVGGTIILNSRYSASKFWEVIDKLKVTNTSVVPTILHDLLMRYEEFADKKLDISSLKRICIGSAPVLPEETLKFYKTFGVRVVQGYGQTETALRVAGVPVDVDEKTYIEMVKNNTIGNALSNNELAIMDSHNKWKKEDEEGEICIKGEILAEGYLNDVEASRHAFKKGWFHSGDLGKYKIVNGKKYFFIIGRIKEIIIKGGVNLSPSAIEDAMLKNFPEVDEVSVVGIPDERMGEEIAAVLVLKKDIKDKEKIKNKIINACSTNQITGISAYETPKKIYLTAELPKTSTGKIQRVLVKKMVAEMTGKEIVKRYFVRKINSDENDLLNEAVKINNSRFLRLPASLSEFKSRAKNGVLFGAFEEKEGLVGTISCMRMSLGKLKKIKAWNEATTNGTLINNDPRGDTLLCIAISIKLNSKKQEARSREQTKEKNIETMAKKYIKYYVNSGKDHVINFHMKPKGGLPGATVWKILEKGRKEDKESMGYNVLMKYPNPTKMKRSHNVAPSILLIEEALFYAWKKDIKNVIAFSRPSGFREYLILKTQT